MGPYRIAQGCWQCLNILAQAEATSAEDAQISTLLAHLLDYHRREEKPMWWAMFERGMMTPEELVEDPDCLGNLQRTADQPVPIKRSTGFWYTFDPRQDRKLSQGDRGKMTPGLETTLTIEELDADNGRALLKLGNGALNRDFDGALPTQLSLIPDEYVNPKPMPESIQAVAEAWRHSQTLPGALRRLILRQTPLDRDVSIIDSKEAATEAAVRVASQMKGATLCIQGPPGTGKTYTGAKVIVNLLAKGKNIGVVSNSHKAVLNLLGECASHSNRPLDGIKVGGPTDSFFEDVPSFTHIQSSTDAVARYTGGLIAGTAWLFSRDDMVDQLDHLVIDEAGQVSLANLVAMSRAAKNLILLGDQMQLAQPVKGTHPGESGQSALTYYLDGHATIPANLGILLPETRRMRPEICQFISEAVYEGRLTAHTSTSDSVIKGVTPGIAFEAVEHDGNIQESDEESQRIVELVADLLGKRYKENGRRARALTLDDILIVAPYNRQVRNLESRLPDGARIGTVDKFQGQQAAVVIVSLAASPGEFGSRGLKFLLDKNRLNVALSRAKCHAILVADSRIASYGYNSLEDMARVNLFCMVQELELPPTPTPVYPRRVA